MDIKMHGTLSETITYYATKYYTGQAEITDWEFDQLIELLREVEPANPILHTPGWGYVPTLNRVPHFFGKVEGLSKYKYADYLNDKLSPSSAKIITPKYDGISCVAYYEHGKILRAVTRGNGIEGTDVTDKFIQVTKKSSIKFTQALVGVRGEFVISNSNFAKLKEIAPEYKNSRNAVAGIINSKEISPHLDFVTFVPYKLHGCQEGVINSPSHFDNQLEMLGREFSDTTKYLTCYSSITMDSLRKAYAIGSDYPCDGVVVGYAFITKTQEGHFDYGQVAFKFEDELIETRVDNLEWRLTRTGKMSVVANIDPVNLDGATIRRVTCFNARYVQENRIGPDAYVEIQRSGMVIPDIQKVTVECPNFELPDKCPECKYPLSWRGVDLICDNPECIAKETSKLYQWIWEVARIKGVSISGVTELIEILEVNKPSDLYAMGYEGAVHKIRNVKLGNATREKYLIIVNNLYKPVDPRKFFLALNIKGLGWSSACDLAKIKVHEYLSRYDEIVSENGRTWYVNQLMSDLWLIPGFGSASISSICDNLDYLIEMANLITFQEMSNEVESVSNNKVNRYFAVTGSLNFGTREDLCKHAEQYGWKLADIKDAEFLVTNNPDPSSSKGKKAKSLGKEIITEEEFLRRVNDSN